MRRTSSIDITWPDGTGAPASVRGRARDVYTAFAGASPTCLAEDGFFARASEDREILSIDCEPKRERISELLHLPAGASLRQTLAACLPDEREAGSPLYLLLDDLPAAILVAPWVWARWGIDNLEHRVSSEQRIQFIQSYQASIEGVCIGFRPGSSALTADPGKTRGHKPVVSVVHPADPAGWHSLPHDDGMSMRRVRRIDVWRDDLIRIDASFQDSGSVPDGGRVAVHEYTVRVTADPVALNVLSVDAVPHVLPHPECPAAVDNVAGVVGCPLPDLRRIVPKMLRRTAGCTHLNDALRALSEVPQLLQSLDRCEA